MEKPFETFRYNHMKYTREHHMAKPFEILDGDCCVNYVNGMYMVLATSRSGHHFTKENILSWTADNENKKRLYINLENILPKNFREITSKIDFNQYPNSIYIIQIRDLLNWYATWVKHILKHYLITGIRDDVPHYSIRLSKDIDVWCALTKEYYHETNYLLDGFIRLSYDDFFKSQDYRKKICAQIPDGVYNETKLNYVPSQADGSTWDKRTYQGMGQKMDVLGRYKSLPPQFKGALKVLKEHPEAIQLYLKHFNVTDEQKKFIDNIK